MKSNNTKPKTKRLEIRLSDELDTAFHDYCTQHGITQSEAIRSILTEKLNNESASSISSTNHLICLNSIYNLALSKKSANTVIMDFVLKELEKYDQH